PLPLHDALLISVRGCYRVCRAAGANRSTRNSSSEQPHGTTKSLQLCGAAMAAVAQVRVVPRQGLERGSELGTLARDSFAVGYGPLVRRSCGGAAPPRTPERAPSRGSATEVWRPRHASSDSQSVPPTASSTTSASRSRSFKPSAPSRLSC